MQHRLPGEMFYNLILITEASKLFESMCLWLVPMQTSIIFSLMLWPERPQHREAFEHLSFSPDVQLVLLQVPMLFKVFPAVWRMAEGILWGGTKRLWHSKRQKTPHFSKVSCRQVVCSGNSRFNAPHTPLCVLRVFLRSWAELRPSVPSINQM